MTKSVLWLATWLPLIKFAQAICNLIIIIMFMDGRQQWYFYDTLFLYAFIAIFFTFFSILLRFFDLHASFNFTDMLCNFLLALANFSFAAVLLWDIWNMRQGPSKFKYHKRLVPVTIGHDAWLRRCSIVVVSLLLCAVLYAITFLKLRRTQHL